MDAGPSQRRSVGQAGPGLFDTVCLKAGVLNRLHEVQPRRITCLLKPYRFGVGHADNPAVMVRHRREHGSSLRTAGVGYNRFTVTLRSAACDSRWPRTEPRVCRSSIHNPADTAAAASSRTSQLLNCAATRRHAGGSGATASRLRRVVRGVAAQRLHRGLLAGPSSGRP